MFKLVVLSLAFAVAAADPSVLGLGGLGLAGLGWGGLAAPLVTSRVIAPAVAPIVAAPNYRGPLSLAPGQPANILAADGRPLDTLSVNLDRAAHLTARAVDGGVHLLKKRSIVGAPLIGAPIAPIAPIGVHGVLSGRLIAPGPIGIAAPGLVAPAGLGWGHGLIG